MNQQNKNRLRLLLAAVAVIAVLGWLAVNLPEAAQLLSPGEQGEAVSLPLVTPAGQGEGPQSEAVPPEVPSAVPQDAGELLVYYFDVGQGDSQLVRVPDGDGMWNMLIDTGEYACADGLTDTLRDLGVERIDVLVCTHQHTDHMGCMARIVQRFAIGSLYMPYLPEDQVPTTSAYAALLRRVEEKGLTVQSIHAGTEIPCPAPAALSVLAPDPEAVWEGLNNYSAVLRLTWGENSFLFTGDAEKESEQVMLNSGETLSADVLKLGHHGSSDATSRAFLEAVDPDWAVISCGANNDYGHPHRETRQLMEDYGLTLYRTDRDGTVLARCDGQGIRFETGLPSVQARQWDD